MGAPISYCCPFMGSTYCCRMVIRHQLSWQCTSSQIPSLKEDFVLFPGSDDDDDDDEEQPLFESTHAALRQSATAAQKGNMSAGSILPPSTSNKNEPPSRQPNVLGDQKTAPPAPRNFRLPMPDLPPIDERCWSNDHCTATESRTQKSCRDATARYPACPLEREALKRSNISKQTRRPVLQIGSATR